MFKNLFLFLLCQCLFFQAATAQDTIPYLKGKVKISVTKGTIECDLTLSDIEVGEKLNIEIAKFSKILLHLNKNDVDLVNPC